MDIQSLLNEVYTKLKFHPSRKTTFFAMVSGMILTGSVKLKNMAAHVSSTGNQRAALAKVERLMKHQKFDYIGLGRLIFDLVDSEVGSILAMDRTNWKFGSHNINYLVISVVIGAISVPLVWIMLDKQGNSDTQERKEVIRQLLQIVPREKIRILLGDREFVGEEWFSFLKETGIPFGMRVKKNLLMPHKNGGKMGIEKVLNLKEEGEMSSCKTKLFGVDVMITGLKLKDEHLFIASNVSCDEEVLLLYKQRWSIERCFKSMKSGGFNLEETHVIHAERLRKLFAVASVALAICALCGKIKNASAPIIVKKHGRNLFSLFTYGLDWIRFMWQKIAHQNCLKTALIKLLTSLNPLPIQKEV